MLINAQAVARSTLEPLIESGHARLHFGQLGEDAVLWHIFNGKRDGFYVDVGCHHPLRFSNTAVFFEMYNWKGINIDMDKEAIAHFKTSRPRDINICAAVGEENGLVEANFFEEGAVNTLDKASAISSSRQFKLARTEEVQTLTLAGILDEYLPCGVDVDLMTVDAEGMDLAVLRSNDWQRCAPKVIAVECHNLQLAEIACHPTCAFLAAKGYKMTSHLLITSIFEKV